MGYSLGCLLSILFWGIDEEKLTNTAVHKGMRIFKKSNDVYKLFGIIIVSIIVMIIYLCLSLFINKEIYNFFTVFLVLNISSKEKQSIEYEENGEYESSIENLCDGIICGFIAPLCIIIIAGNLAAVTYFFLMIIDRKFSNRFIHLFMNIINIIPCFITAICIVIINIFRVKKLKKFFTYYNLKNLIIEPIFGVTILCSYLYDFNLPYYKQDKGTPSYIEYYGPEKGTKLNKDHIDRASRQGYIICLCCFILFILWYMRKIGVL